MVYEPRNATLTAVDLVPTARDVGIAVIVVGGVPSRPPVVTLVTVELEDDAGDGDGAGADVHDAFPFAFHRTHGEQGARGVRYVYVQRSKAVGAQGRRFGAPVCVCVCVCCKEGKC